MNMFDFGNIHEMVKIQPIYYVAFNNVKLLDVKPVQDIGICGAICHFQKSIPSTFCLVCMTQYMHSKPYFVIFIQTCLPPIELWIL